MQINSYYTNIYRSNLGSGSISKETKTTDAIGSVGFGAELLEELEDSKEVKTITEEQKQMLREKYTLDDLKYTFYLNGDSGKTNEFMKDLKDMGIITENAVKVVEQPGVWEEKPDNYISFYASLSDEMKAVFDKVQWRPSWQGAPEHEHIYVYKAHDANEMNLLDACRHIAVAQQQSSSWALGEAAKEQFNNEAEIFNSLADLLEEIFC